MGKTDTTSFTKLLNQKFLNTSVRYFRIFVKQNSHKSLVKLMKKKLVEISVKEAKLKLLNNQIKLFSLSKNKVIKIYHNYLIKLSLDIYRSRHLLTNKNNSLSFLLKRNLIKIVAFKVSER